jgi:outer membrane cobalamin receptor
VPVVRLLLFSFLCCTAFASELKITVQSPSGESVGGIQVKIFRAADDAGVATQVTAGDGVATFPSLNNGDYHVIVLAPGFAEQSQQVSVPQTQSVTVELKLATPPQTVVVSATATPTTGSQTGASVSLLNSTELKLMNPVANSDALRFVPGAVVNASGQDGSITTLFVRGGESNYNKVLVDGVPVNEPGGIFDFGVVPMNNVERLELERGPESTVYGSDAMTSVVQLWTATGSTRRPLLEFGADGGNFSTAHGYASLAGARGIFDYNVFADQFNTDGQGVNNHYSNSLQGGNIGLKISPRVAFRLRLRHYNTWTGVSNNWSFNGDPVLPPDPNQYAHQNNFLASGDVIVSGPGSWQHQFRGFEYHHVRLNVNPVDDPDRLFDTAFRNLTKFNVAGFSYQGVWSPRVWAQTSVGYTFEDENGYINNDSSTPDFPNLSTTHGLRRNHYLFGQEALSWKRVSLLAGLGYVNNESFGSKVSPRVSGSVVVLRGGDVFGATRLRAGYAEGIKEPSFEQSFGIAGGFVVLPNPDLKPEQTHGIEAGIEQSMFGNRWSVSAVYYHNQFLDQIQFLFNDVTFTSQYVNFNRSLAQGAEVVLSGRVANSLTFTGSYTYTSTEIQKAPPCDPAAGCDPRIFGAGAPLLRRPKHLGSALLTYNKRRWGATAGVTAVGSRPDSDFLFGLIPPIYHAAGYARVDFGGRYDIGHHVTAYANLNNAFDKSYNEVLGYPALGVNVRAGLRFRFGGE